MTVKGLQLSTYTAASVYIRRSRGIGRKLQPEPARPPIPFARKGPSTRICRGQHGRSGQFPDVLKNPATDCGEPVGAMSVVAAAELKLLDIFRVADLFGGCLFWVMTVGGPEATDLGTPSATHARGQT